MSIRQCTRKSIQRLLLHRRYYSLWTRPHAFPTEKEQQLLPQLYDFSPRTLQDIITPSRIALLDLTLSPYLPEFPPPTTLSSSSSLYPGYHFIFFPPQLPKRIPSKMGTRNISRLNTRMPDDFGFLDD